MSSVYSQIDATIKCVLSGPHFLNISVSFFFFFFLNMSFMEAIKETLLIPPPTLSGIQLDHVI